MRPFAGQAQTPFCRFGSAAFSPVSKIFRIFPETFPGNPVQGNSSNQCLTGQGFALGKKITGREVGNCEAS